jgi:IrrE N-terminal-like domain
MKSTGAAPNLLRAGGAAFKLTREYGFAHPRDIRLEDIAMDRGVLVIVGGIIGCEGRLVRRGKKGIIRVSDAIPEVGRQRFAIAHEMGHWELHDSTQWFVCSETDLRDYEHSAIETEANTFASELLMPTHLIRPRCEKTIPSLQLIQTLAEDFNVSLTAAAIRFIRESRHECTLVCSDGRQIRWWVRKTDRFGVWFRSRQPIHQQSLAWYASDGEPLTEEMEQVPTEAWFPELPPNVEFEVYEQSMKLGSYKTVLTLLCIGDLA